MRASALDLLMTPQIAGVCLVLHACLALLLVELFFACANHMARRHILMPAFVLALVFAMLYVLEMGMLAYELDTSPDPLVLPALRQPVLCYAAGGFGILVYAVAEGVRLYQWRRTHLTSTAIKEALDRLPQALVLFDLQGVPVLTNLAMEGLSRELTGHEVRAFDELWGALCSAAGTAAEVDELLVHLDEARVWMVRRDRVSVGDDAFVQVSAADITDVHALTHELRTKKAQLRVRQCDLQKLGRSMRTLVRAKEVLDAKTAVHDEMGHLLLMTQHYMADPSSVEGDRLLELWGRVLDGIMAGQTGQGMEEAGALQELATVACTMGITLSMEGDAPTDERIYGIMARAVRECLLNVGKHAHGKSLHVRFSCEGRQAEFTNDGAAPSGPIRETGGLRTLRQRVEAAGGTMSVESAPAFRLVVSFR